jgi:hypothetical protein
MAKQRSGLEMFNQKKWGVFNHYLYPLFCPAEGEALTWNETVHLLDVERLAYSLHKMNAGYYFITLMQGTSHLLAPNATYDAIAGTKPGEACAIRDIPLELSEALAKYDIDLCLYYTGDGPWKDETVGGKFGFVPPLERVGEDFVKKWAAVLEEYAVRYGERVKAWWIDGCYGQPAPHRPECAFRYTDELLSHYYNAIKKGNPNAAVAFNDGVDYLVHKYYSREEYTAGESRGIREKIPQTGTLDGALHHVLFPLGVTDGFAGGAWACPGVKYRDDYILQFIKRMNRLGGAVTVDIKVNADGSFDREQEETLRRIGERL